MRFKRLAMAVTGVMALGFSASPLQAQTAYQTVTFSVVPMSRVAVSGVVAPLIVTSAAAGQAPTSATVGGATYAITTNESNQKISASLDQTLPAGVSLAVALGAPAGAASMGSTALSTAAADVVTGISALTASALPITYTLSATSAAPVAASSRKITFTITAGQ
jgi:hypothetical protein